MAMNYKEVSRGASASDRDKYAKGMRLIKSFVNSLETEGLLPARFETISLPKGALRLPDIQTVGMSNKEMVRLADSTRGLNIGNWGIDFLGRAPTTSEELLMLSPVILGNARAMGIPDDYPTTKEVWNKAKKFGNRVTAEEMLQIAVEAAKGNIQVEIGKPLVGIMEPVTLDLHGCYMSTLYVERSVDGLWLGGTHAKTDTVWDSDSQFIVVSRDI